MKRSLLGFLLSFIVISAVAQSNRSTVAGTVIDGQKEGVVGAVIEIMSMRDTTDKKYTSSAIRGAYQFKGVAAGEYRLTASFLGYKTVSQQIKVTAGKDFTVPAWTMEEDPTRIESVNVVTQAVRTTINGDTLVYNASAYKVMSDADTDELLSKMPGINVNGGTVEVQGETVQKILIDGREFFGNDVATAIKTIPAEAVKSIEVFDKLSDEAEFSGIDDGNSYKAINIVTHNKMKTAIFGKMNAFYGFEPREEESTKHYGSADGNLNFFREKSKTTLRFRANNMNGNSRSRMGMGGINYINTWGEDEKFKLEGSYTYNASNNKSSSWTERDYFLTEEEIESNADDIYEHYDATNNNASKNGNHNFNARTELRISERQRLMVRAQLSFNDSWSQGNSLNTYFPISGIDPILLSNWNNNDNNSLNTGINGNYFLRIGQKAGRTLHVSFNANYSTNNSGGENYSEKAENDPIQQRSSSDNYNYSLNGGVTYAEPIGSHAQATIGYNVNYNYSNADRLTNLFDWETGEYNEFISPEYSNRNNTDYLTQRVGPGFRFSNDGTTVSAQVNYQNVLMNSDREYPAVYVLPQKSFHNITYSVMTRIKINMENRIMVRLNSRTSNPSVTQLQDVVDISNVNNIRSGNPKLQPSYSHRLNLSYNHSGIEKGTTFSIYAGGSKNQRQIVDSVVMNQPGYPIYSPDGEYLTSLSSTGRYSKPVNLSGDWSYNGGISYGFPLNFIGCNFNIGAHGSFNQSPSILNGVINRSKYLSGGGSVSLSSNFSQYVDFNFSYSPNYNKVTNTMSDNGNNEYMRHSAWGNIRVVFGFGLTLFANGNYSQYVGLSQNSKNLNNTEFICNFAIGMKVLRKMGEVQLTVNDAFNRNTGFSRSWNSMYMQNSMSEIIGRYYGIRFTYNLRRYGQTRKGEVIDEGGVRRNDRRGMARPMGGPEGGPGRFGGPGGRPGGGGRFGG